MIDFFLIVFNDHDPNQTCTEVRTRYSVGLRTKLDRVIFTPIHLFPPWVSSRQVENNVEDGFHMARRNFKFFWRVIQVSNIGLCAYSWTSLNFDVPLPWGLNPFEKNWLHSRVQVLILKHKCFSFFLLIFFKVRSWNSKGEVSEVAVFDFTHIGL